jgi:hypothetical protein
LNGTLAWNQIGADIDGEAAGDYFGQSVSLSADGTTVAIGAWLNDGNGTDSGHVRVFKLDGTLVWNQIGADIDGEAELVIIPEFWSLFLQMERRLPLEHSAMVATALNPAMYASTAF